MTMDEYQDYMKLLFDKYLKYVPYVLSIIAIAIIILAAYAQPETRDQMPFNLVSVPIAIILSYMFIRWVVVKLPSLLFGTTNSVYSIVKGDINKIHKKHHSEEEQEKKD